jgi:hypothetical protein
VPNNTTVNKVIVNGVTKIDLTGDTAISSDVALGKTFHDAAGILQTGTAPNWTWMGRNPTLVATCANEKVFLKDTNFATWTPSTTTASVITASADCSTYSVDITKYDFVIFTKGHTHLEYNSGATGKAQISDQYYTTYFFAYTYWTLSSWNDPTVKGTPTNGKSSVHNVTFYKNTSGTNSLNTTSAIGIYPSPPTATFGPTSIKPVRPAMNAKCSSSIFSTANAQKVNKNTSYYELKVELWLVDFQTTPYGALVAAQKDISLHGI